MTCGRVSRELLERFRFGEELDERCAPHLEHLQSCLTCREELGMDRALVRQLRRALEARVEGFAPSPSSWQLVRERALAAEAPGGLTAIFMRLTGALRAAGAVAAVALVVAVGMANFSADEDVTDFQLRAAGRGQLARVNALPTDPPPYEQPRVWYSPTPLPPPETGRFSVIMSYSPTGEPVATTRPVPRPVTGLLR
jgi:anti-sigma factor RsiW